MLSSSSAATNQKLVPLCQKVKQSERHIQYSVKHLRWSVLRLWIASCWRKNVHLLRDHSFSMYTKFSEKLTSLTPWYAHVREMLVFRKIFVHTKWMIPSWFSEGYHGNLYQTFLVRLLPVYLAFKIYQYQIEIYK